ncbi:MULTISPECIES: lactococcin 972 family bacteriocin [Curtobacterium]|uniref:lactococcin 972 family bacteriocin n=1 Tax=Curtobacterium TaxID=2034 RepID=UPI001BE1045E|nr:MULTISPECIES: lactococcin 972 family bacteriocin [Curtobacterium]MBT1618126.1 hypothetical protein [Curtobacterium flaccumfaciens pv. poinsettiae]WIE72149.1 lactococcin 972 family bacteriocin [Curtobacterium sp. MCJR17_020]
MKRTISSVAIGAALSLAFVVAGPAMTSQAWESVGWKTQYPSSGGTWKYGFVDVALRSNYTVSKCHGSTVEKTVDGKVTNSSRSVDTASGKTSVAAVTTTNGAALGGNYYYRVC